MDRAIRLWLLFQYWLNHVAHGSAPQDQTLLWQQLATQGATLETVPDTGQLIQLLQNAPVVEPAIPGQFRSIIQTLFDKIFALSPHQFALYRIPFFGQYGENGTLAVYVSREGTVYLITSNNTVIQVSNPAESLQEVLEALLAPAIAIANQPAITPTAAITPTPDPRRFVARSFSSLSSWEWLQTEGVTLIGFTIGAAVGQHAANILSLENRPRSLFITASAIVAAVAAFAGTPVGLTTAEQTLANIFNGLFGYDN